MEPTLSIFHFGSIGGDSQKDIDFFLPVLFKIFFFKKKIIPKKDRYRDFQNFLYPVLFKIY